MTNFEVQPTHAAGIVQAILSEGELQVTLAAGNLIEARNAEAGVRTAYSSDRYHSEASKAIETARTLASLLGKVAPIPEDAGTTWSDIMATNMRVGFGTDRLRSSFGSTAMADKLVEVHERLVWPQDPTF